MYATIDFLKSILNAVTDHIVVIDENGFIQYVNQSWINFGKNNNYPPHTDWYDINYLQVCDASAAQGDEYAIEAAIGIRGVIKTGLDSFHLEYPCHSPNEKRWFIMRIKPFQVKNTTYYVISHQNITERKLAEEKVLTLSQLDGLCNIPNRRYFDEFLKNEWKRSQRLKMPITLAMIDIDYFKLLNDTYGHQTGDECLKKIGMLLKDFVKRPSDLCARYGGEEFTLIFGGTPLKQSIRIIEKLREQLHSLQLPNEKSPIAPIVTLSIGLVTMYPDHHTDQYTLIKAADEMLYNAKKQGRNQLICNTYDLAET